MLQYGRSGQSSPAVGINANNAQGRAGESDGDIGVDESANGINGGLSSVRVGLLDRLTALLGASLALVVGPRIKCQREDNNPQRKELTG